MTDPSAERVIGGDPVKGGGPVQGRDSTRKIQRAITAQEQRKQLPAIMENLAAALADYRTNSGRAFLYDGQDFQVGCLVPSVPPALMHLL